MCESDLREWIDWCRDRQRAWLRREIERLQNDRQLDLPPRLRMHDAERRRFIAEYQARLDLPDVGMSDDDLKFVYNARSA